MLLKRACGATMRSFLPFLHTSVRQRLHFFPTPVRRLNNYALGTHPSCKDHRPVDFCLLHVVVMEKIVNDSYAFHPQNIIPRCQTKFYLFYVFP